MIADRRDAAFEILMQLASADLEEYCETLRRELCSFGPPTRDARDFLLCMGEDRNEFAFIDLDPRKLPDQEGEFTTTWGAIEKRTGLVFAPGGRDHSISAFHVYYNVSDWPRERIVAGLDEHVNLNFPRGCVFDVASRRALVRRLNGSNTLHGAPRYARSIRT